MTRKEKLQLLVDILMVMGTVIVMFWISFAALDLLDEFLGG